MQKGTFIMDDEYRKRIANLEARMNRIEAIMQALVFRLDINPAELVPLEPAQPPMPPAIRKALLAGNKIEAIKLYRAFYDVGLKEAKAAIDAM